LGEDRAERTSSAIVAKLDRWKSVIQKKREKRVHNDFWLEEFQKKAGTRLRLIFEKDLGGMPRSIIEKMEELRKRERELMVRKSK
jgi:hypothetical protein